MQRPKVAVALVALSCAAGLAGADAAAAESDHGWTVVAERSSSEPGCTAPATDLLAWLTPERRRYVEWVSTAPWAQVAAAYGTYKIGETFDPPARC
jgi:hypothetical protein